MTVLIVGCGDLGQRIARRHLARGEAVTGLVRRSDAAAALATQGIAPLLAELDAPWSVPAASRIYWCAPPPAQGEDDPRLALALQTLAAPAQGLLYISTTGVYGDCQGRWIDESEPLKPTAARSRRRLAAEKHVRAWAARVGARALTLRVPGIYGPGRLPAERLARGEPVLREADSPYSNRIHVEDLADAALRVIEQGTSGAAYNAGDGVPTTMTAYFRACAVHLGLPAPPEIGLAEARQRFSPTLLSYLEESRRIDVRRLRALGFVPRHADLASGLRAC